MTKLTVADLTAALDEFAPPTLAESWDNTGLLLGDSRAAISTVLTCLTLTPDVAAEAITAGAGLVVTHHPILFRPVQRLTTATAEGRMLLDLARAGVAVYSPHTSFDSTAGGINAQIADRLGLRDIVPLRPAPDGLPTTMGTGRRGVFPTPLPFPALIERAKTTFGVATVQVIPTGRPVARLGIGCGSAGELLADADAAGCDAFLTGEARFHTALEARSRGVGLILVGHYASERFAVETLATWLGECFPALTVTASAAERDPLGFA